MPDKDRNLDEEMERDAEIRRQTDIRNALGPIEGTDAERNAAESALSDRERAARERSGSGMGRSDSATEREAERTAEPIGLAHIDRGIHSDESMTADMDSDDVWNEEDR